MFDVHYTWLESNSNL